MHSLRFVRSLLFALVLCALVTLVMPAPSFAQLSVSVTFAPPELPVYEQPVIPGPGYIWTPGYWQWSPDDGDFYWVPGTWVQPPEPEVLWTPGYWSWGGDAYNWNDGYWGPQIGFYGGVNYGYGYTGDGYEGGYWKDRSFFYNRSVNNITNVRTITNVYNKTVVNNVTINNVSYNGGRGGRTAQPTAAQRTAASARHIPPTATQTQHQHAASTDRALRASVNHGKPPIAATSKPGVFSGGGVVAAKAAAPYHPAPAKGTPPAKAEPRTEAAKPKAEPRTEAAKPKAEPRTEAAKPKAEPRTEAAKPKAEPRTEAAKPKAEPRTEAAKPKAEPRTEAAKPKAEPRTEAAKPKAEPRTEAAKPKAEPRPQAAQPKNAPPPKSAPHPSGEKPKGEHEPSH